MKASTEDLQDEILNVVANKSTGRQYIDVRSCVMESKIISTKLIDNISEGDIWAQVMNMPKYFRKRTNNDFYDLTNEGREFHRGGGHKGLKERQLQEEQKASQIHDLDVQHKTISIGKLKIEKKLVIPAFVISLIAVIVTGGNLIRAVYVTDTMNQRIDSLKTVVIKLEHEQARLVAFQDSTLNTDTASKPDSIGR